MARSFFCDQPEYRSKLKSPRCLTASLPADNGPDLVQVGKKIPHGPIQSTHRQTLRRVRRDLDVLATRTSPQSGQAKIFSERFDGNDHELSDRKELKRLFRRFAIQDRMPPPKSADQQATKGVVRYTVGEYFPVTAPFTRITNSQNVTLGE